MKCPFKGLMAFFLGIYSMGFFKDRQFLPKQGESAIPTLFYNLTPKIVFFCKSKNSSWDPRM